MERGVVFLRNTIRQAGSHIRTEEEDMSGDNLFLQTFDENGGSHVKRKQSSPSKVDFVQDPNQKI